MTTETRKETLGFQAEVKQLLQLMIHSLYSNKEIFLRELVSNAADAADKLRFEALKDPKLLEEDPSLRIRIDFDADARTITIDDNGSGVPEAEREEVFERFARGSTASRSGSGLGLALVAQQAELHGGTASLNVSPLGGAQLVLRLPGA